MLNTRLQAAQTVADKLIAAENAIDIALQRTTELAGVMPIARGKANLAAEIGQDALERAVETIAVLAQARRQIVATHHELATTQEHIGLKAYALGAGYDKGATTGSGENITQIAA